MGGRPQIQIERKTSLDLEVMGEWLKGGERVRVYFGEGKREGEGEGEEGGKKKKKGEKKSKKDKASSVYGLSLQEMYAESGFPIPIVVAQCMSYLKQSNGLKLEVCQKKNNNNKNNNNNNNNNKKKRIIIIKENAPTMNHDYES